MKSLQFSAFGDAADVIELVDIDEPSPPGPGEVLGAIEYTPINPSELLMVGGHYGVRPPLPAPLGQEGVARILAVGEDVANVKIGDRVIVPLGLPVWRERLTFSAHGLDAMPVAADAQQLSMIHVNPATAGILLEAFVGLSPGDWVLQNAGNSGVGRNVIAFARELGVRTVSLVRRPDLVEGLKQAGGDVVLVDGPGIAKQIEQATSGAKIRLALDGVAGDATGSLSSSLAPGGKIVFYAGMSGKAGAANPIHFIFHNISLHGFWLGSPEWRDHPKVAVHKATAIRLITERKLKVPVTATYRLTDFRAAIKHAQQGGKILFQPTEA
ncbi:MAG TPA: zinc-dependent alcohol dehydrogenase family protein [Caulobacter sp.]|nr:zinc-dependent alcohol dehydrogenase family protein [Caulobacter sp.]